MTPKKLLSGAFAITLLFGAASCGDDDDTDTDTEEISPELDDSGGEDGLNTEDITPELDEGTGEDGLTEENMGEEETGEE